MSEPRAAKPSRSTTWPRLRVEAFRASLCCHAARAGGGGCRTPAQRLRERLDASRAARQQRLRAHLEEHGISVGLVFQLRQLRERMLRCAS